MEITTTSMTFQPAPAATVPAVQGSALSAFGDTGFGDTGFGDTGFGDTGSSFATRSAHAPLPTYDVLVVDAVSGIRSWSPPV